MSSSFFVYRQNSRKIEVILDKYAVFYMKRLDIYMSFTEIWGYDILRVQAWLSLNK